MERSHSEPLLTSVGLLREFSIPAKPLEIATLNVQLMLDYARTQKQQLRKSVEINRMPHSSIDRNKIAMSRGSAMMLMSLLLFAGVVNAETPEPCAPGDVITGRSMTVSGESIPLRSSPNADSGKIVNQPATQIIGRMVYATLDYTTKVMEECTRSDWTRIRLIEPYWLQDSHVGWVQSNYLRAENRDDSGRIVFTEADFIWDNKKSLHKSAIVAGVNKVHRENSRCNVIDPTSANISGSKGTASNPVFFVTCGTGLNALNVFFSKSDVEDNKMFTAAVHIDRRLAVDMCESYAKSQAKHPSTVRFSRVLDIIVNQHPNGRTAVMSSFKEKNGFNMELEYIIRCLFDATDLIEAKIRETQ